MCGTPTREVQTSADFWVLRTLIIPEDLKICISYGGF
jgi:hypothetical protein